MWTTDATAETTASPAEVWQRYVQVARWNEWDHGIETSALDGPFAVGTRGRLKPVGAPTSAFVLTRVEPNRAFADRTVLPHPRLPLATLAFEHELVPTGNRTRITHRVKIAGPLGPLFARLIGRKIASELPTAVRKLATIAAAGAGAAASSDAR
jgi:hypothetical protein